MSLPSGRMPGDSCGRSSLHVAANFQWVYALAICNEQRTVPSVTCRRWRSSDDGSDVSFQK